MPVATEMLGQAHIVRQDDFTHHPQISCQVVGSLKLETLLQGLKGCFSSKLTLAWQQLLWQLPQM